MPNKFGGYDYDAHGVVITDSQKTDGVKLRQGDRLGEPGGYTGGGIKGALRVTLTGVLLPSVTGTPNIRERYREFEAAHQPGTPRPLRIEYYGETFVWAEPEPVVEVKGSPTPFIGARAFEVSFYCADPYVYQNGEQGPQVLGLGSTNINNGGFSPAAPVINLVVTHPGTVTLQSDAGAFEIYANLTGTYSIDSYQRFVSRNTANYHYRWDGVFPSLKAGQTTLFLSVTHGSVGAAQVRWFNRD